MLFVDLLTAFNAQLFGPYDKVETFLVLKPF